MHLNRRRFLKVSAAACGLATQSSAATIAHGPLIDTHVYIGHWPLRRLSSNTPTELAAQLRRANVTQAWAGSFDGLFHKDIHGVNSRLVETCSDVGDGLLIPIGAVNPMLPDWEEDVCRCHETFKMPGIRLHPTYHGYKLDDPRFAQLLELATARGLFVQLVAHIRNESQRLLTPRGSQIDLALLAKTLPSIRSLRLVISNAGSDYANALKALSDKSSLCFEVAQSSRGQSLRQLVDRVSADRIVYGSGVPLNDVASTESVLAQADLTPEQVGAIRSKNALQLRKLLRMSGDSK